MKREAVNLKQKKRNNASILIDRKRFHALIFRLDEGIRNWPSSVLVARMINLQKYTTRLCLSTGYFFWPQKRLTHVWAFRKFYRPTSNLLYQWTFDGIEIS